MTLTITTSACQRQTEGTITLKQRRVW